MSQKYLVNFVADVYKFSFVGFQTFAQIACTEYVLLHKMRPFDFLKSLVLVQVLLHFNSFNFLDYGFSKCY